MLTITKNAIAAQLPGIPESFWTKRPEPETEDDLKAFITLVKSDYREILIDMGVTPPAETQPESPKATKETIDAIFESPVIYTQ